MTRSTVLSAFTGLGGLDLGLECAGFSTVASIEKDPDARASIQLNAPNWGLIDEPDIAVVAQSLSPRDLGLRRRELSILAGGPPCQPFSKAAQWRSDARRGLEDDRAKPLISFLELAEIFLPRVILIENVPGFTRGRTSALHVIGEFLNQINMRHGTKYRADFRCLNAADYGVPQRRNRAIIVAERAGHGFQWPEATHRGRWVRSFDALADLPEHPLPRPAGAWSELLPSIPEGGNYLFHTSKGDGVELFGNRTRYWSFLLKLAKDQPSWTLPASPGPSTGPFHWDNRPLSVRELLRLQSFPHRWKVIGTHIRQVRQVGNATPPLLAEILGRALATQLHGTEWGLRPRLTIPRRRAIPPSLAPTPIPRRFHALVGRKKPHPGPGRGPGRE